MFNSRVSSDMECLFVLFKTNNKQKIRIGIYSNDDVDDFMLEGVRLSPLVDLLRSRCS